jgi:hypothetical protein
MKRLVTLTAACAVLIAIGLPALATDADDVVAELELRGYFIERGADAGFEDLERLVDEWSDVFFVVLARDPSGGADLLASDTLEAMGVEGTVVVVGPAEVGAVSTIYGSDDTDRALDALLSDIDRGYYEGFSAFASALSPQAVVVTTAATTAAEVVVTTVAQTPSAAPAPSGGGGGGFIFLLIIVGIGALIWWAVRRSKRNREEMLDDKIDDVKAEIQAQLSEAANDILELEDDILLSDNEEAKRLYYAGSKAYAEFQEQLTSARSFAELGRLAEGVDVAHWQLESAEALLEGKPKPPKPTARPGFEPPAPATPTQSRHPELPDDLQMRRDRRDARGSRPRQRSSGGLGGLGAAAVILKSLQEGRKPRSDPRRASSPTRATGVDMSDLGGSSSRSTTTRRPSSSSRAPKTPTAKPIIKGRSRKRRK